MIECSRERFDLDSNRLRGDDGYGSAESAGPQKFCIQLIGWSLFSWPPALQRRPIAWRRALQRQ
jgi:hypothetical protein